MFDFFIVINDLFNVKKVRLEVPVSVYCDLLKTLFMNC